jgi:hypothetical protein
MNMRTPAMNLNDMPHGGALFTSVSRGPVLFEQQARQFLRLTGLVCAPAFSAPGGILLIGTSSPSPAGASEFTSTPIAGYQSA